MNNRVKIGIALTVFVILNTMYIRNFEIMGIIPNINVIVIALIGLNMGMKDGFWFGVYLGLWLDALIGTNLGLYTLIFMYIGYISGVLVKGISNENIYITTGVVLFADFFYNIIIYIAYYLPKEYNFFKFGLKVMIPEATYTVLLFVAIVAITMALRGRRNRGF